MPTIVTICGSARRDNPTAMALAIVQDELAKVDGLQIIGVEPDQMVLFIPGMETGPSDQDKLQEIVSSADGVILATPEYHGSYSSLMKVVIDNLGYPSALKGKPVSLLGVAGGRYGAIKSLEHLRSVCAHVGSLVLPDSVSISQAGRAFDDNGNCTNPRVETSLRKLAQRLILYLKQTKCPDLYMEVMSRGETDD